VQSYENLSQAEKNKLLALTEGQIKSLKDSDKNAKNEYLTSQPKGLDPGLRNIESVRKTLDSWGK